MPFGDEEGNRWIEVAPSGAETPIALCPPGPSGKAGGKDTGIALQTDDIDAFHAQLRIAASTSTQRSVAWATPCRRCSGCATRRATR